MMLTKRGTAHFEMIMAFVLFVGFVFFLFTILKPYDEQKLSYSVLDGILDSLKDKVQTNLTKVFLKAESPESNCFYINLTKELFTYELNNSRVFNISGEEVDSNFKDNSLMISKNQTFYYLYYSPDFTEENNECTYNVSNYTLGSIEERKILSLKMFKELESLYTSDYMMVKNSLGVPPIYEFAILSEGLGVIMEKKIPETGDVLSKEYVIEALNSSSGRIINTKITIKVW